MSDIPLPTPKEVQQVKLKRSHHAPVNGSMHPSAVEQIIRKASQYQTRLQISIALGEADIRAGRILSHVEAGRRLARWLK